MAWFVLGALILFLSILLARTLVTANPQSLARVLRMAGAILLVVLSLPIWFRLGGVSGVPFLLLGLMMGLGWPRFLFRRGPGYGSGAAGQRRSQGRSRVETPSLVMTLDHDSGQMDGEIQVAPFAGRMLSTLAIAELAQFLQACQQADSQAAALVEAYIGRHRQDDWRAYAAGSQERRQSGARGDGPQAAGAMTPEDAFGVLGLDRLASWEEVKTRHRLLMKKFHPDHGGSSQDASRINQARQVLEDYLCG